MNTPIPQSAQDLYEVGTILTVKVLKVRYHNTMNEQQVLEYLCPLRAANHARFHLLVNLQRLHTVHLNFLEALAELARSRKASGKRTFVCGLSAENERLVNLLDPTGNNLTVCHAYEEAFAVLGLETRQGQHKTGVFWDRIRRFFHTPRKVAAALLIVFAIFIWSTHLA
jgi:anti-anti-sigma regulatory factor